MRYLRWVHSPNWPADVGSGLVAGLLASFIVVAVLAWRSEWVADRTLEANPSCAAPRGVVPVKVDRASGAEAPNDGAARKEFGYRASNAVDDASESMWIPPLVPMSTADTELAGRSPRFVKGQNANVLTLRLDHEADIRLVCVVNGASLWFTSYQNWGRVRTVEVWGHDHDDAHFGILRSLGSDDFPNAQLAARNLGTTDTVHIALVDSYAGQRVETFNLAACLSGATSQAHPDVEARSEYRSEEPFDLADGVGYRYEPGCILEPKAKAGLTEVYVYADDREWCPAVGVLGVAFCASRG